MTSNDKQLLLVDLSARLPYNIAIDCRSEDSRFTCYLTTDMLREIQNNRCYWEYKPYLFPLSSMTDEMWDKEFRGYGITEFTRDSFKYDCETLEFNNSNPDLSSMVRFINQLIKNNFDIYGLIPMGLAEDATGLNIY